MPTLRERIEAIKRIALSSAAGFSVVFLAAVFFIK